MMKTYRWPGIVLLLFFLSMGSGCSDNDSGTDRVRLPIAINHGDECHVCGMIIENYPGPKGETFERSHNTPRKFCSTRDMFAYLLQPETTSIIREVYVHDMAKANWLKPGDAPLVDARKAWYVVGQPLRGAMGPTLASFAKKQAAEDFVNQYGGKILRYKEINLDIISTLDYGLKKEAKNTINH